MWEAWTGHGLAFTFEALVIASILYSLPFAVQPMAAAFAQVDPALLEASALLGAGPLRTFWRVILPLARDGVLTGLILAFAHTLGEFGVVLMVGGNLPGITRTVSIAIYDDVQSLNLAAAHQTALALLLFSFVTLSVVYGLSRRPWAVAPWR
jgi:molybdate transport system permease protein